MDTAARPRRQSQVRPTALPHHLTKFVGRESDMRGVKGLLRNARMVSITGTGGAGKTRLAAEVARTAGEEWTGGTWWIDLAGAGDVLETVIASARLPGRTSPLELVTSWLQARRVLLVLDNCEHVIEASASFCQAVLERCPGLTILATSREPLGVPGEARWPLTALTTSEAARLFEVRALLVRPNFDAAAHREAVARICDRLDRLPLAIEMAAARLDVMSPAELLANLDDRFRVLASGSRAAPERQQTMTATIDWSYRLLRDAEARLFRRLAVFQGGFTMEAAQKVCGDRAEGILAALTALVQKSMAVADQDPEGRTRYRLLESHQAFAAAKLDQSGERAEIGLRHYRYFAEHATQRADLSNAWAAIEWAGMHTEEMGLDLAVQLAESEFSDSNRTRTLLVDLLARSPTQGGLRARAQNVAARLTAMHGDYAAGAALADQSLALARNLDDPELLAYVVNGAGMVSHARGELDAAHARYSEALSLLEGSPERRLANEVRNGLGLVAVERGNYAEAEKVLAECVAASREDGDVATTARYLESLANAQLGLHEVESAAASWREALAIFRDLDDPFGEIFCLGGLALVAAALGDHERTLRLAAATELMSRKWSLSSGPARTDMLSQAVGQARQGLGPARSDRLWSAGSAMTATEAIADALGAGAAPPDLDLGPLSRREREVTAMIAAGLTNREIAERLFISERTAEGHVERIRGKLGFRSRTEIAAWAVERGVRGAELDNH
jgi:predicted ATPase/DNA-binding CsgD family transcriptional regulator